MDKCTYKTFIKDSMHRVIKRDDLPSTLRFYKLTCSSEIHYGITYRTGLNVDPVPFKPEGECKAGGMYFFDQFQLAAWTYYANSSRYIREVQLCDNSQIYVEDGKYKTDRFILRERKIWDADPQNYIDMTRYAEASIAISHNIWMVTHLPEEMRTETMYRKLVRRYPGLIKKVPSDMLTEEFYLNIIEYNPRTIADLSPEVLTYRMCVVSIENGGLLIDVPEKFITKEICDKYIDNAWNAEPFECIKKIPENILTEDMCIRMIKNGISIECVPKRFKTEKFYERAIKETGLTLGMVPKNILTEQMCLQEVAHNGMCLSHVPVHMRTEKVCIEAIKNGGNIKYVPDEVVTKEMCEWVVARHLLDIEKIPERFKTRDLFEKVLENIPDCGRDYYIFTYAPKEISGDLIKKYGSSV